MADDRPSFVVVGGGLAGSLLAALLGREGYQVDLIERRGDPRAGDMSEEGRSINLAISTRGLNALARLGLDDRIRQLGIPLYGRMIHPVAGDLAYQPYGVGGQAINSFSRSELNRALIEAAAATPNVCLTFGRTCREIDYTAGTVTHVDSATGSDVKVSRGIVIGADGAFSAVRAVFEQDKQQTRDISFLEHGYKQLSIPPRSDGTPALGINAMHIWPRGDFMMMAMANRDQSFTVTLYLAKTGPSGFDRLTDAKSIEAFFRREFPDAVPLMPALVEEFLANPVGSMVTVRALPWHRDGKAVLAGDAAHAIVPFYGQGANAGFEDCLELLDQIKRSPNDLAAAFARYEAARKPNTEAIADLALANFHEMRDKTGSTLFLLRKRFEKLLHRLFPKAFVPLYTMISFTLIPYAEARARATRQAKVIRWMGLGLVALAALTLGLALR